MVFLALAAVLGNIAIRAVLRRSDSGTYSPEPPIRVTVGTEEVNRILREYGAIARDAEPPGLSRELHRRLLDVAMAYDRIAPESGVRIFSREFMQSPYEPNRRFVQIGEWGDGSPVLAARDPNDAAIYISDVDECMPNEAIVLARSFDEYLCAAVRLHEGRELGSSRISGK
ncbi:MAG: hypothetical protein D6753_04570 [Planctomycetota bacterium]|nr:MAG: hypothetical protein D6753_04570 [Planctomycetota bacterium]